MSLLVFDPVYKEKVWGGNKLNHLFGKKSPYQYTGESWECAAHPHGQSVIRYGKDKGKTLTEVLYQKGSDIIGRPFTEEDKFPLLIKLIDARTALSVQVHPNDDYARRFEQGELGKTEAWIVLQAEPGAKLICDLEEPLKRQAFIERIEQQQTEGMFREVAVKAGDVLSIPAGTIHAIGAGIVVAEVQQNSDTTYRIYDWGRLGLDGQPRQLHLEKSADVIDFDRSEPRQLVQPQITICQGYQRHNYFRNDYFGLEKLVINQVAELTKEAIYKIYLCLDGEGYYQDQDGQVRINKGDTCLVPANVKTYQFEGKLTLLETYESSKRRELSKNDSVE